MIGDSVNLRAQDYLTKAIPGIQIDAVVSRQLENGMKVFETDISNKVLLKNVVIALGTNTVSNYKELLDQYVEKLPKGRRLILVTPYDGRYANDQSSESVQTRLYELELAKKYDFITIADWYQVAIENPNIWVGTDSVHFNMETNGGELYAQTVKKALDKAEKGPVKK